MGRTADGAAHGAAVLGSAIIECTVNHAHNAIGGSTGHIVGIGINRAAGTAALIGIASIEGTALYGDVQRVRFNRATGAADRITIFERASCNRCG